MSPNHYRRNLQFPYCSVHGDALGGTDGCKTPAEQPSGFRQQHVNTNRANAGYSQITDLEGFQNTGKGDIMTTRYSKRGRHAHNSANRRPGPRHATRKTGQERGLNIRQRPVPRNGLLARQAHRTTRMAVLCTIMLCAITAWQILPSTAFAVPESAANSCSQAAPQSTVAQGESLMLAGHCGALWVWTLGLRRRDRAQHDAHDDTGHDDNHNTGPDDDGATIPCTFAQTTGCSASPYHGRTRHCRPWHARIVQRHSRGRHSSRRNSGTVMRRP